MNKSKETGIREAEDEMMLSEIDSILSIFSYEKTHGRTYRNSFGRIIKIDITSENT